MSQNFDAKLARKYRRQAQRIKMMAVVFVSLMIKKRPSKKLGQVQQGGMKTALSRTTLRDLKYGRARLVSRQNMGYKYHGRYAFGAYLNRFLCP